MSDGKINDLIRESIEGIRELCTSELSVGRVIETSSGVSVIPISRVNVGFATGGVDLGQKKLLSDKSFGGGGGSGISVTPLAFLAVSKDGVSVHNVGQDDGIGRIVSLFERSPEIIEKIRRSLGGEENVQ